MIVVSFDPFIAMARFIFSDYYALFMFKKSRVTPSTLF
jgi:hypothetical protein